MSAEIKTYHGNCHCGQVKFTVTLPDLRSSKINRCNCSICTKNGYLLVYPKRADVKFLSGEDTLSAYRFGNRNKPHMFCGRCSTSIFIDFSELNSEVPKELIAMNIRTFVDIEEMMKELDIVDTDGKQRLKPAYQMQV